MDIQIFRTPFSRNTSGWLLLSVLGAILGFLKELAGIFAEYTCDLFVFVVELFEGIADLKSKKLKVGH